MLFEKICCIIGKFKKKIQAKCAVNKHAHGIILSLLTVVVLEFNSLSVHAHA